MTQLKLARIAVSLWLLVCSAASVAHPASVELFDRQTNAQVADYVDKVVALEPNDVLVFDDGISRKSYKIGRKLGAGNTTLVIELADDPTKVIRIPLRSGIFKPLEIPYTTIMRTFQNGVSTLEQSGIPSVKMHDSMQGQFAVVDRVKTEYRFDRFLHDEDLPPKLRQEMTDALVDFARRSAVLTEISDFRPDQFVYDAKSKQWILFDWTNLHKKASFEYAEEVVNQPTAFINGKDRFGDRTNFFEGFAGYSEDRVRGIRWFPEQSRYRWVSDLANRIHEVIQQERGKIWRGRRLLKAGAKFSAASQKCEGSLLWFFQER